MHETKEFSDLNRRDQAFRIRLSRTHLQKAFHAIFDRARRFLERPIFNRSTFRTMLVEAFQFIGINTWRPESLSLSKSQLLEKFVQGHLLGYS